MLKILFESLMQVSIEGIAGAVDFAAQDYRDDPIYKKNLQRLIERNREFEETKNEPRS